LKNAGANKKSARTDHEYQAQVEIFSQAEQLRMVYPELSMLNASLNGVRLPLGLAVKAKRMGMKRGYPDIHLPIARGGYHALYIELKAGKNKPTPEQWEWIRSLNAEGNYACVCWGVREAVDKIIEYLEGRIIGKK
jgi:hypothetical protein